MIWRESLNDFVGIPEMIWRESLHDPEGNFEESPNDLEENPEYMALQRSQNNLEKYGRNLLTF